MITHVNGQLRIKNTNYTKQDILTKTLSLLNKMIKALDLDINVSSLYEYHNDVDSLRYLYPQLLPKNHKDIKYHLKIESNKTVGRPSHSLNICFVSLGKQYPP